jgi:hypothetical protein
MFMNRRFATLTLMAIGCAIMTGGGALAQRQASGPKIRGDVYALYAGEIYRGHSGDHTFLLTGNAASGPAEKEVVGENAAGIRAALTASQKAYGRVSAEAKKNPTVAASLKEIDKHQAAILTVCDSLDAEAGKDKPDSARLTELCAGIMDHIDGADQAHDKVLKVLRIPPLDPNPQ